MENYLFYHNYILVVLLHINIKNFHRINFQSKVFLEGVALDKKFL